MKVHMHCQNIYLVFEKKKNSLFSMNKEFETQTLFCKNKGKKEKMASRVIVMYVIFSEFLRAEVCYPMAL